MYIVFFFAGGGTRVFDVFGGMIGWVQQPLSLYNLLVSERRAGRLYRFLGVEYQQTRGCLFLNADEGRILRPLIVLENAFKLQRILSDPMFQFLPNKLDCLLREGVVEYLDAGEEYSGLVLVASSFSRAVDCDWEQTHMEIHGSLGLSSTVSRAFATKNQGPRILYTGNLEKRSISLKLFEDLGTTCSLTLWEGQDPLQSEIIDKSLRLRHREPNGFNVNVAILCEADTIEDAWVIQKEASELGLGRVTEAKIILVTLTQNSFFRRPHGDCKGQASADKYHGLHENGLPVLKTRLAPGACVVGIVSHTKGVNGQVMYRCVSKFIPWNASFVVAKVEGFPPGPPQYYRVLKVTLHRSHMIAVGNKFSCGHGQKGTCGRLIPRIDCPVYMFGPMAGTSPVLYLSAFAMNRCTLGFLIEMLVGTAVGLSPAEVDQYSTIFQEECDFNTKLASVCHILKRHGLCHTGRNTMFDGASGKMLHCTVFSGFAYFRVLKHIADLKLRSRAVGPEDPLVRQPSQGQWQNGGLRVGELDYWNLSSHGITATMKNFNYDAADKFLVYYCKRCSVNALGCAELKFSMCQVCKRNDAIVRLFVPYVSPLTQQEMFTAGWGLTYKVADVDPRSVICDEQGLINPKNNKKK